MDYLNNKFNTIEEQEEQNYTEEQLLKFGYYLLSPERQTFIKNHTKGNHKTKMNALQQVYEIDVNNFKRLISVETK